MESVSRSENYSYGIFLYETKSNIWQKFSTFDNSDYKCSQVVNFIWGTKNNVPVGHIWKSDLEQ